MRSGQFHWILLGAIITSVAVAFGAGTATHKTARPLNKAESDPDMVVRQNMIEISKQLGVTCTHCHDAKNFKSTALPTWKVAKDHIRVTQLLNSSQGFNGAPKVDCYTCHRGEIRPKPQPTPAD
jgi:hypothetical protein